MAKVSVLIPAYNVELYIDDCIRSVMDQTLTDWEIIVVDDASTDNTLSILRTYEKNDSRIHVYTHDVNRGQSCGRNTALSHANGEYVYFLDSDDRISPNLLNDMVQLFERENLDVCGFETENFCDDPQFDSNVKIKTVTYRELPVMNGCQALNYCVFEEALSSSTPTYFMRRSYLESINLRFTEGILHEDIGYIFELISRADRITFIPEIYFHRRIRMNSTMTVGFTDKNIEGYMKSYYRSFDLEDVLIEKYGRTPELMLAIKKWRRDMFGRLRQLYLISEKDIYHMNGGKVDEEMRRAFETLKLLSCGQAQAQDILGSDLVNEIKNQGITDVYLIGLGQYTERMIGIMGSLDIAVKGIIVPDRNGRNSAFGIKLYSASEVSDKATPVMFSVSRYYNDIYEPLLNEIGMEKVIKVKF